MARARLLKPGFFTNEDLCEIPAFGRLLFAGLWTLADKAGRLDDRPKRIKAEVFPYDNVNVVAMLDKLEERGFIERYTVGDAKLIQIAAFEKHQHPHKNEPESVLPGPKSMDERVRTTTDSQGESVGATPDIVRTEPDIVGSRPAVAKAVAVAEANTEAVAEEPLPPAHPFSVMYSQKHRERTNGGVLKPIVHGRALSLEQKYGAEDCIQVAEIKGWEHDPSYYVGALEERKNGKQLQPAGRHVAGDDYQLPRSKYDVEDDAGGR